MRKFLSAIFLSLFICSTAWAEGSYDPQVYVLSSEAGQFLQVVNTQDGDLATGTTSIPQDDTIPQNTEGDEFMTLTITPNNTNNKLKIEVTLIGSSSGGFPKAALFQDSTAGALAAAFQDDGGSNNPNVISFVHFMTAGTTSATTFKVRAGGDSGTFSFNGKGGSRLAGGVMASSITITEIQG